MQRMNEALETLTSVNDEKVREHEAAAASLTR